MWAFQPSVQPGSFSSRVCGPWSVRDDVDGAVSERRPERLGVGLRDPVGERIGAESLDVRPVIAQQHGPGVDLRRHVLTPILGTSDLLHDTRRLGMQQVERGPRGQLEPQQQRRRAVPDDAVVCSVRPGVGPEVVLAAIPVLALDVIHERLVVGMDHEPDARGRDRLEDLQQLAVVMDADARHVRDTTARYPRP